MSSVNTTLPLLYGKNVAQDLYAWALTAAYRTGWRLYDPDYALQNEPDVYEKVRRDPVISSAIEQRIHAVAGPDWRCNPARAENEMDQKVAQIMEDLLSEIRKFSEGRYELSLAVLLARAYSFIEGERKTASYGGAEVCDWWVPKFLKDIDRRRIRIVPKWRRDEYGNRKLCRNVLELFSLERERWLEIQNPEYFIRHVYNDEEARLGHGRGLLEAIYFYWYAKEIVLREGLQGLERWAQGLTKAGIDGLRDANSQFPNEEVANAWLALIEKMRARHAIVYDKEDEVDTMQMQGTGHQMVTDFLKYLDEGITRLLTGALLPSGHAEERGSYARAETEADTQEAVVQYDRKLLEEVLTRDLIGLVWYINYPNFVKIGLGAARCPTFSCTQEEKEDPEQNANTAATLLGAGIPLLKEEVYDKTGWTMPGPGEDVILPPQPTDPFSGGPFDFKVMIREQVAKEFALTRDAFRLQMAEELGVHRLADRTRPTPSTSPDRCPDGTFEPKSGDCSGHEAAEGADDPSKSAPLGKEERKQPGSQLDPKVQGRLRELGVTKLPDAYATDVTVHDLEGSDVDERAVMTWRDKSGKLQHAYTAKFHEDNAKKKWERVQALTPRVDDIKESLRRTLTSTQPGSLEHEGALVAAIVAETGLRPGNQASTKRGRYGISTLQPQHVSFEDDTARLEYIGKSGKPNVGVVSDPLSVAALRQYAGQTDPNSPMFGGGALDAARVSIPSGVKLKDFRTIVATQEAQRALSAIEPPPPLDPNPKKAKRQMQQAFSQASKQVAQRLNNTPAVAKASYIHPNVFEKWASSLGVAV